MAGILCNRPVAVPAALPCLLFTFSISVLYLSGTENHLYKKRFLKKCVDWFLLATVFTLGSLLARSPSASPFDPQAVYQLKLRCEERLSGNYLLTTDNINLFLSRYDTDTLFHPGDLLYMQARIVPLSENSNPGEFSYYRYLKQKNTNYKIIPYTRIEIIGHEHSIRSIFEDFRQKLLRKSEILFPDTSVRSVVNALCLGYKSDLDKNIRDNFIQTGTIHLLAVSGLHTGAIYLLLTFILTSTGLARRKTDLFTIPLLWGYACLTGLSPSVIRAATILTFIALGKTWERDYIPVNAIAASAFFTLLVQPHLIGSVSFLMSYSAYTGIVLFYPYLNRLPGKLSAIPSKLWSLCCLSFSAQLLTLPINAYYFHSLNLSGIFINLLAIPLATVMLYGSIILLLLPVFIGIFLSPVVGWMGHFLLYALNLLRPIGWNITGLYPTLWHILLIYLNYLLIAALLFYKNKLTFRFSLAGLSLLLIFCCIYNSSLASRKELIVFNRYRETTILLNYRGFYSYIYNTAPDSIKSRPYLFQNKLKSLPPHSGLLHDRLVSTPNRLKVSGTTICIAGKHTTTIPSCQILIVTGNNLPEKLFKEQSVYPERIIADFSNSYHNLSQWEKFCKEKGIIFENTAKTGYASIALK